MIRCILLLALWACAWFLVGCQPCDCRRAQPLAPTPIVLPVYPEPYRPHRPAPCPEPRRPCPPPHRPC